MSEGNMNGAEKSGRFESGLSEGTASNTTSKQADVSPLSQRLLFSAKRGDAKEVATLLEVPNIDVNVADQDGRTALWFAADCRRGDPGKIAELLLEHGGLDINAQDKMGQTPIFVASKRNSLDVARLLIGQRYLDINKRSSPDIDSGTTPLGLAIRLGHEEFAKLLLAHKDIEINRPDKDGRTPLYMAVQFNHGRDNLVSLLIAKEDIKISRRAKNKKSPAVQAAELGYSELVELLLTASESKNTQKDREYRDVWFTAAKGGHANVVSTLLRLFHDVNWKDQAGFTALHHAAKTGHTKVVELLLNVPSIDMHPRDDKDKTPLFLAAEADHLNIERLFLAKDGINMSPQAPYGQTMLAYAVEKGENKVVQRILRKGVVDIDVQDAQGRTLLWIAAEKNDQAMVETLLGYDHSTLRLLCKKGELSLVRYLLNAGCQVDRYDEERSALQEAILCGNLEIARELVAFKADLNMEDDAKNTPISLALRLGRKDMVHFLLESGADIDRISKQQWLHAFGKETADGIRLEIAKDGKEHIAFFEGQTGASELHNLSAAPCSKRRLFLLRSDLAWKAGNLPNTDLILRRDDFRAFTSSFQGGVGSMHSLISWFPAGKDQTNHGYFKIPNEEPLRFSWTTVPAWEPYQGTGVPTMDHFSTLPDGWIPEDGPAIIRRFWRHTTDRWLHLCDSADEHVADRRLEQLVEKGNKQELILKLANDAQTWANFRKILKTQTRTVKDFTENYCRIHNKGQGHRDVETYIEDEEREVLDRFDRLDQELRDLLQIEFAWASINEAYRSTSLATSMKRLSWVTFIFLPAMFASSLFGMNVSVLKDNPDWRWALLTGAVCLSSTLCTWLIFKYGPIEAWLERKIGRRLDRLKGRSSVASNTRASIVPSP